MEESFRKQPELITPNQITEHIEGNEALQKELFGKILTKKEIKLHLSEKLTSANVLKIMDSIGMRPATLEELEAYRRIVENEKKDKDQKNV